MAERKEYIIAHSDAFIALPGGIGTLDEVLEIMVSNQLGPMRDPDYKEKTVVLFSPDGFYNHFFQQIDLMGDNGFFRSGRRPKIIDAQTVDDVMKSL